MKIIFLRQLFVARIAQYRPLCADLVLDTRNRFLIGSPSWYYAGSLGKAALDIVTPGQQASQERNT
jgi:hypothetical protein